MYLRVKFLFVLTPSPCGHSPYILLRKTQGGEGEMYIPFASASMLFKTSRHAAEYGRGSYYKPDGAKHDSPANS